MDSQETIERGFRTAQALEVLDPAMDRLHLTLVRAMLETPPMHSETILAYHAKIQAIEALKDELRQAVTDGETASLIAESEDK